MEATTLGTGLLVSPTSSVYSRTERNQLQLDYYRGALSRPGLQARLARFFVDAHKVARPLPLSGDESRNGIGLPFGPMQHPEQTVPPAQESITAALVCPICWDHQGIEQVKDIVLSARPIGGRDLSQVSVYRCARWHLFAVFQRPSALE